MHPRICLHQVAFIEESTADFLEFCRASGLRHATLVTPLLIQPGETDSACAALEGGDLEVAVVNHPFANYPDLENDSGEAAARLLEAIDIADRLGAGVIYLLTGGRGSLTWEAAAQRFADLLAPCREAADERGIQLLVETASCFNADFHIAHTLDDTARLAELAEIGVCIDLHPIWFESGLREKFAWIMPITGLVQVSDYVAGDRSAPCRAVPGDGMIPLERLLGDILEAGYEGVFDLELVGPRIVQEGPRAASLRAAEYLTDLLTRLGA